MAYRRSITARAKLFYQQQQRVAPSFSDIHHDDREREEWNSNPVSRNSEIRNYFQHRFFGTGNSFSTSYGSRNWFQDRTFAIPAGCGQVSGRNYSTGSVGEGTVDKIEILNEVVDVLGDKAVEVAPAVSEVAVAAADSYFPVAALQYLIDYVHSFTGFHWWASIVVTTILIRWIQLPLIVNQMKATSKFTLLRPKLEAINAEMQNRDMNPNAVAEGQAQMKKLFKEYGVTPFTPLKGILITGPVFCSFFFAINNMAEKVPSFKEGGAFWFTDLTTPDSMYIFPVLTALTFWITVELNAQEGLEGNPTGGTIKNASRVFAILAIPFTASFPKAMFCYWITSNLFSLTSGLVMKNPKVKEYLGIPIIPVAPPSTDQKPGLSFFDALKKYAAAQQQQQTLLVQQQKTLSSPPEASPRPTNRSIASSSNLNQRVRNLEKEVKGKKKGKRR